MASLERLKDFSKDIRGWQNSISVENEIKFPTIKRIVSNFGSIIFVVGNPLWILWNLFCVEKKSHMTYNEKRSNNSLERIIWNNYILSQNYSISKTLISNL